MKNLILITLFIFMTACGKVGPGTQLGSAKACGPKSVFSAWQDNGSNTLSFTGMYFGTISMRISRGGVLCDVVVEITGDECSGTFDYKTSVLVPGQGILTTFCDDQLGNYDYTRSDDGIVFGKRGSVPEEYH